MSDEVTIRAYQPGDEHALVEGYNAIFPQSRSLEHWCWKFRDAPIGASRNFQHLSLIHI